MLLLCAVVGVQVRGAPWSSNHRGAGVSSKSKATSVRKVCAIEFIISLNSVAFLIARPTPHDLTKLLSVLLPYKL